jgi:hypothetical protein
MTKASIEIAETLARLSDLTIFELRGEWRRLHRAPPPMRLSRDLLMREIMRSWLFRALIVILVALWGTFIWWIMAHWPAVPGGGGRPG